MMSCSTATPTAISSAGADQKSGQPARAADVRRAALRTLLGMADGVFGAGGGFLGDVEPGDAVEDRLGAFGILGGTFSFTPIGDM